MKCKHCKQEIISVRTSGGKDVYIDFSSVTPLEQQYLVMVNAEQHPLSYNPEHHTVHFVTHPECRDAWWGGKGNGNNTKGTVHSLFGE